MVFHLMALDKFTQSNVETFTRHWKYEFLNLGVWTFFRYGLKPEYGREPLHPTPPRPGFGPPSLAQAPGGPNPQPQQGSVMMVYGLDLEKVNADKLFNLFCLYGNVLKVSIIQYICITAIIIYFLLMPLKFYR